MSFVKWMREVNRLSVKVTGLSTSDFEDHCWRDNFNDELSPGAALYYFFEDIGHVKKFPELFGEFVEASEIS